MYCVMIFDLAQSTGQGLTSLPGIREDGWTVPALFSSVLISLVDRVLGYGWAAAHEFVSWRRVPAVVCESEICLLLPWWIIKNLARESARWCLGLSFLREPCVSPSGERTLCQSIEENDYTVYRENPVSAIWRENLCQSIWRVNKGGTTSATVPTFSIVLLQLPIMRIWIWIWILYTVLPDKKLEEPPVGEFVWFLGMFLRGMDLGLEEINKRERLWGKEADLRKVFERFLEVFGSFLGRGGFFPEKFEGRG